MSNSDTDAKRQESFFSDEVTFYLHELVNKHNIRYWCETNPRVTIESAVKSLKLNVGYTMSKTQLIGPFLFLR